MPPAALRQFTACFVAGVAAANLARFSPVWPLLAGVGCLAGGALFRRGRRPSHPRAGWFLLLAAAFFAGALLAAVAWQRLVPAGPVATAARWADLEGKVASEAIRTETGYRFLLRASDAGRYWRRGELLYVTVAGIVAGPDESDACLLPGHRVAVEGLLSLPHPPGNPGEFDFPRYLASQGVRYTLRAFSGPVPSGPAPRSGFGAFCRAARDRLLSALDEGLPPGRAALLAGLLFGDTSRLPAEVALDFRRSGVYHILAVSGSNVAFIAGGFWMVAGPLLRLAGLRGSRARRLFCPATAFVLAVYAVMSGMGPSVARATAMAEAGLLYLWFGRRRDVWAPLCLAVLYLLLRQPLLVLDVGFQLSFAATLGLLVVYPPLWRWVAAQPSLEEGRPARRLLAPVAQAGLVSLAAQVAVTPILALHFGEVSLVGLVANLFIVPLSGLDVTVGLAAGTVHLAGPLGRALSLPLFWLASLLLGATTGAAHLLAGVPFASAIVGSPGPAFLAAYYLGLAWAVRGLSSGRGRRRALVLALIWAGLGAGRLGAVAAAQAGLAPSGLEVVFLDVGQGDAIFARLPGGRSLLIDCGPAGAGERVVAPYLRHTGCGRVDLVVVTHAHDDHAGGLAGLLSDPAIAIGEIVVARGTRAGGAPGKASDGPPGEAPGLWADLAATRGIPVREVAGGDLLRAAGGRATLAVLAPVWPDEESPATASSRENDASLVLRLEAGPVAFLFPGDLETTGEDTLVARAGVAGLRADVLKLAHHGSAYATGQAFLDAVRPAMAICSVGTNTFGHPSPATLVRVEQTGAAVFVTKLDGAVTVLVRGEALSARAFGSGRRFDWPSSHPTGQGAGPAAENHDLSGPRRSPTCEAPRPHWPAWKPPARGAPPARTLHRLRAVSPGSSSSSARSRTTKPA